MVYRISRLVVALSLFAAVLLSAPFFAHAQISFGGMITSIVPCNTGFLIFLGPPTPGFYMYNLGARSYPFGPPTHPGQWLLGQATGPSICMVGPFPIGAGLTILFHGSSI